MTGNQMMTAPVLASRCPVFAPSIRQGMTDWSIETPFAIATVKGKLTQIHRNLLDAACAFAIDYRTLENGALEVLVDPYTIATKTGSSRDYKWLESKLHDMKVADVDIVDLKNDLRHHGGIVSEWREAKRRVPMPGGKLTGDRPLLAITISAAWMRIYSSTLTVQYKDLIESIARLPSGVQQALVRYCLTNRELNKQLESVLVEIGAITPATSRRQRFAILKEIREANLSFFGIEIRNDIVFYKQHKSVTFKNAEG